MKETKDGTVHLRPRFRLVRLLIQSGPFLIKPVRRLFSSLFGSVILILLNSSELEEQVKEYHHQPLSLESWGGSDVRTRGLSDRESHFVTKYLKGKKRCFVFGCGGGRESIALAKLGFEVTGIDSSRELVENAKEHASALSLSCTFEVKDMLYGPHSMEKYDALFLTQAMYSAIPTRKRRIAFLRGAKTLLKDDGFFYLEFLARDGLKRSEWKFQIKKWLARLCGGNKDLERGDIVRQDHFWHVFNQESELLTETEESGFKVVEIDFSNNDAALTPFP